MPQTTSRPRDQLSKGGERTGGYIGEADKKTGSRGIIIIQTDRLCCMRQSHTHYIILHTHCVRSFIIDVQTATVTKTTQRATQTLSANIINIAII